MADVKSPRTAPRFDVATLESLAGTGFARGETYWREGRVCRLTCTESRVTAVVEGGQAYRVTLTGAGHEISGDCECAAAESLGFCKHMVATALAANAAGGDVSVAENPPARIHTYLQALGVDALVAIILEAAERDEGLMRRLDLASASVGADDAILEERLSAVLEEAIEPRDYIGYSEARGWAGGVDEALDAVEELLNGPNAAIALRLSEHAIAALERALNSIDNSSGHCGGLIQRAADIHLAAAHAAPPEPVDFARELFAREMAGDLDTWSARQAATPTRSAPPGSRNIVASPKWPGRSCLRARDGLGSRSAMATPTGGFQELSISLPNTTAISRRASPCAPKTFRRPGPMSNSWSSAGRPDAPRRPCVGRKRVSGRSMTGASTRG